MNKAELITAVSEATDLSKEQTATALTAILDEITKAVAAGDKVTLPGFGSFERRERSAREGRNPQTGETMQFPASKSPAFKALKGFKDAVNV